MNAKARQKHSTGGGMIPGEREWRDWLVEQEHPGGPEWVDRLAGEATRWLEAGEPGATVRLLEQAVGPASPAFSDLTGPPAKDLAARLDAAWTAAAERDASGFAPWAERFQDLLELLRSWVRYRRILERQALEAGRVPVSSAQRETQAFEHYYANWVLGPFRENVIRILEARGLSRRRFCESLKMSEAYLSQVLNGKRTPTLEKLADISWALRTEFWRLFATKGRLDGTEGLPWDESWHPEPGDKEDWRPGTVNRPYDALERHFKLVFYPGPDLPGEKIPARSYLIVDPRRREMKEGERYVLEDDAGTVTVGSFAGRAGGDKLRFVALDGTTAVTAACPADGEAATGEAVGGRCLGAMRGVLVEG